MLIGIDSGSTTVKIVLMDNHETLIYQKYQRHFSKVREKTVEMLREAASMIPEGEEVRIAITGSAGLGIAKASNLDFVQEVFATAGAVEKYYPGTDAVIELGGEDAKIIFLTGGLEERMNGSCAGGTGAFIDQMATLLNISMDELDELSLRHEKIYSIASRCGVFAKSDIQPLLNQGARKEDVCASILQAVVNQTISGLAQGRKIEGNILFLGGPLFFLKGLQQRFKETLRLSDENAHFPADADVFVAEGAALYAKETAPRKFPEVLSAIENAREEGGVTSSLPPLFENQEAYDAFAARHASAVTPRVDISTYQGDAYLGIDAGSTTTKLALITPDGGLLYSFYGSNKGNPVDVIKAQLEKLLPLCGDRIAIKGSGATGYGEELIQTAFHLDVGIVETVAHFHAARYFDPQVDFILDIGGQDMKCFKIKNGAVDSILLNEACSSGCGSFIETFAKALEYDIADFAKIGLFAAHPVDLGSRCTVFMNSSIKQAQKEGRSVEDISAGLSMSIVKNAIYKVIRASSAEDLGRHIVVQGGTFLNDAVLRGFELEIGRPVTRPVIAGMMGAYGAALYAKNAHIKEPGLITQEELKNFTHTSKSTNCNLCGNHCSLTINTFGDKRRCISGNRCERPLGKTASQSNPNLYKFKYETLKALAENKPAQPKGQIGLPFGLNQYENLPFWHTFFTQLGYEVVLSGESSRELYTKGQHTIPSDTVCYPAKLLHGHIENLLDMGVKTIFYPCMSYNFNEGMGDNHYNCPVVAYYPELLAANVGRLKDVEFLMPYFGLHRPRDFAKKAAGYFSSVLDVTPAQVKDAAKAAYQAYDKWEASIKEEGRKAMEYARANHKPIIVLAGRPYHIDPEINHGIDQMINSFDLVVLSEDCVSHLVPKEMRHVLNQWTYHARLYNAARYICTQPDMQLVQLVSFGCGIDAITTDETREILESNGKLYTQLKIDEVSNLGAAKIRIRSLLAAMNAREVE